jgi:hypothetical protein
MSWTEGDGEVRAWVACDEEVMLMVWTGRLWQGIVSSGLGGRLGRHGSITNELTSRSGQFTVASRCGSAS